MAEIDPIELSRWQGGVDRHLLNIDGSIVELKTAVDTMPDRIEARLEKVINGSEGNNPHEKQAITFRWIVEKLAVPIMLAVVAAVIALVAG